MAFSQKQKELISRPLERMNIIHGTISSGKTFACNYKAVRQVGELRGQPGLILFAGRTLKSLESNVLLPLQLELGKEAIKYSLARKVAYILGERIELEGCNNLQAEYRIRGASYKFVYLDELTLLTEEFVTRCLGGLRSGDRPCFLGSTNPDAPNNFIKTKFLDKADELELNDVFMDLNDNPSLTDEYKTWVHREYTGVLKRRFIHGEWCAAEGLIYQRFADNINEYLIDVAPKDLIVTCIGVDFGGNKSLSAFCTVGYTRMYRECIVLDEEVRQTENESPSTICAAFADYAARTWRTHKVAPVARPDSAETILVRGLREELVNRSMRMPVINAKKTRINDRIRLIGMLIGTGRLKIMRHCTKTIEALQSARYNPKAKQDERLDDGSYCMDIIDAMEYAIEPYEEHLWKGGRNEKNIDVLKEVRV